MGWVFGEAGKETKALAYYSVAPMTKQKRKKTRLFQENIFPKRRQHLKAF
jgi:hypothetical protein